MKADLPTHTDAREAIAYAELLRFAHDEGLKSIARDSFDLVKRFFIQQLLDLSYAGRLRSAPHFALAR